MLDGCRSGKESRSDADLWNRCGGALFTDGRVYRGARGEHPEMGLIPVHTGMPKDYSGVDGSLESLASGSGMAQRGEPLAGPMPEPSLRRPKMGIRKLPESLTRPWRRWGGPHGSMPIPFALSASFWEEG